MVGSIQGFGQMGPMDRMGGFQAAQPLSDDQKQQVSNILAQYDPNNVSASDAKAIFQAFDKAGIKGPGLREAVKSAGFDADQVFKLAHPGGKHGGHHQGNQNKVDVSALQSLQTILSQYDLSNLTSDQESELSSKLNDSGLMKFGGMIDVGA